MFPTQDRAAQLRGSTNEDRDKVSIVLRIFFTAAVKKFFLLHQNLALPLWFLHLTIHVIIDIVI
ncbi:hypothetical protein CWM53_09165 [Klebsiella sp. A-Nf5]|nr:hypothetical protein CWM53_09165 [Klebsiella sp. A-Nf5]PJX35032.1 hypothetical protein CWM59_24620 [Klebsiella sp. B-Nf7]PJX45853.1 hypothetical protein CWM60_25125 [Klebsiella sp. C1-16S-Nf17]